MTFKSNWMGVTVRALIVVAILYLAYYLIGFALPLIYPFVIGLMISMLIEPIIKFLEKKARIPRGLSVAIILILLLALIFSLLIFVIAEIVIELTNLAEFLPNAFKNVQNFFIDAFTKDDTQIKRIIDTLQNYLKKNPQHQQKIADSLSENIGVIANKGTQLITDFLAWLGNLLSDLPFFLTVLVFIVLATLFISLDFPQLKRGLISLIPKRVHTTGGIVLTDIKKALVGFIRAQMILITITALIVLIGLLVMKVPYALTIALLIGLVDLLPYLGVGAVLIPWLIYSFITGDIHLGIGLSIIYGITLVVRQVLEPRLLASTVGLNPLLTLIAIFIGLQLIGFLGIIVGPIVVVILLALHRAHIFRDTWLFIKGDPIKERVE
ncbi:sporulation integral membrane protein YtvI [Seinonella peptonophila]|uniref:Sporulation integral membrane protein YtvI n=1 Tax=Seinonella peptonophila TaxID=112248 RepID=A0A1M4W3V3_9BACL|nr:sporulation integral membrane protein YtvI [Seinonella peptonophila]SHE75889.1 sporulation integral membrane protein YtvI [Seinonella peptonophila]